METQDRQNWEEYCRGDESALDRIYASYKDKLFSYCLYVTGDVSVSEDIVQSTFLKLLEQKYRTPAIRSLKAWLFVVARNLSLNRVSNAARREVSLGLELHMDGQASPEQILFLKQVLCQLKPAERDLILLREHQGFSIGEIAEMLDATNESVRVRLYRIRKKISTMWRT